MAISVNDLLKAAEKKEEIDGLDLCEVETAFIEQRLEEFTDERLREEYEHIKALYENEDVVQSLLRDLMYIIVIAIKEECTRRLLGDRIPVGSRMEDCI